MRKGQAIPGQSPIGPQTFGYDPATPIIKNFTFTADANGEYRNAVSLSKRATEIISSAYLRGDLGYKTDRSYVSIGGVGACLNTNDAAAAVTAAASATAGALPTAAGSVIK